MLTRHHAAEPGEVALNPVGVIVAIGIGEGVVDAPRAREVAVKLIPVRGLVGEHGRAGRDARLGDRDAVGLARPDEREGAAVPLPERDDDAAFAGLVLLQPPVNAILFPVLRPDVPAEIGAVHLDFTGKLDADRLAGEGFPELVREGRRPSCIEPTGRARAGGRRGP